MFFKKHEGKNAWFSYCLHKTLAQVVYLCPAGDDHLGTDAH